MVNKRRPTIQSWTVRRLITPKCFGPTIWVTENLSGGTILLNLGCLISGERDVLLQGGRGLAIGEVVIDAVFESHADKGQAVERSGANNIDP
jgi:hypothetical protein